MPAEKAELSNGLERWPEARRGVRGIAQRQSRPFNSQVHRQILHLLRNTPQQRPQPVVIAAQRRDQLLSQIEQELFAVIVRGGGVAVSIAPFMYAMTSSPSFGI